MKYLFFSGEGCSQCKALKPKFIDICTVKNLDYQLLDFDDDEDQFDHYGIRSIPYIIVLDGDDIVDRGPAADILKKL